MIGGIEWVTHLVQRYRDQPAYDVGELDRPRLGLSERAVASHLAPHGDVLVVYTQNRPGTASTAPGTTHGGKP